ncbi:response regulator [Pedobacter antarcticus]|uniref:response regulator n=1 Tax=Pedobacter antarcticus TaxID=34086 RepID=UPI001C56B7AC|nr:response regulator [Pedobacter antarcticus]
MKKFMLIDDDEIFVFLTKKTILKVSADVEVQVFADGQQAISHLQCIAGHTNLFPDAIFLDLNMPVMDGWEFLDEYQKLEDFPFNEVPLYIVSSSISPYEMDRSAGIPVVTEFIIKPLVKEKFLEILENL